MIQPVTLLCTAIWALSLGLHFATLVTENRWRCWNFFICVVAVAYLAPTLINAFLP